MHQTSKIGLITYCILIAFTVIVLGCDQPTASNSTVTDPVSELEKIVASIEARKQNPVRWIEQSTYATTHWTTDEPIGRWTRNEEYICEVTYDVQKTDSLVSPYLGTIKVQIEHRWYSKIGSGVFHDTRNRWEWGDLVFPSEADAMRATKFFSKLFAGAEKFAWRDGHWVKTSRHNLYWPFSDTHHSVDVFPEDSSNPPTVLRRY